MSRRCTSRLSAVSSSRNRVSRSTAVTRPFGPTRLQSIRATEPPPPPSSRQRHPAPMPMASRERIVIGSRHSSKSSSRRRPSATLPDNWVEIVEAGVAHWALLDDQERELLGELMAALVEEKRWEAAYGFALTDEIRTVVAAQASLLLLELDFDWYRAVQAIVVHPSEIISREPQPGPVEGTMEDGPFSLLGLADHRLGPVLIAWDAAKANARHPAWGRDVVLHEFAHKLDMLDDVVNGTPPLHRR